ncbi:MFS transporter [Bacillus sp. M6-12]|uniref:MDR family MFS transporter n=1 Tax=Bacillus sp. M6-12 TaxID=2054166 RepID=UPI000C7893C6|nr:MFS transporter [Bacillus sp. M6-12]PLS18139.1 MFS transporter [Bacillus sp. M6-12]
MSKRLNFINKCHPVAWGLIAGTFLSRAGFFMCLPFLGIYLVEVKGFAHATVGAILGISYFVSTFTGFLGGVWSDRFGRFPILICSMFLWSSVFVGFVYANEVWEFFIVNALSGFCRSLFEPAARALLADVTPEENRMDAFNLRYFAINMGGAIGPLTGLLVGASKNATPFTIAAFIYLSYGLLILWWKSRFPESRTASQANDPISLAASIKIVSKDNVFALFLAGNIFVVAGYAHLDTTLSQYLGSESIHTYSILFITNAIAILSLQFPLVTLMKKTSPLTALKVGNVLFGLGILGFGVSKSVIFLIAAVILFSAGEIMCFIIGDVFISEIAPVHLRGAYYGASGLQFIGQSGGAWIGGILIGMFGNSSALLVFGILALLTILAYPCFEYGEYLFNKRHSGKMGKLEKYS